MLLGGKGYRRRQTETGKDEGMGDEGQNGLTNSRGNAKVGKKHKGKNEDTDPGGDKD